MRVSVLLIVLAAFISAAAAEYEYVPLVREGVQWTHALERLDYGYICETPQRIDVFEIRGDTVVDDIAYNIIHWNTDDGSVPIRLIRESDKKVFLRFLNGNKEYLIYDFNEFGAGYDAYLELKQEMVEIDGKLRKAYYVTTPESPIIIEGIGFILDYSTFFSPFGAEPDDGTFFELTHVTENGKMVYKTMYYVYYEYFAEHGIALSRVDVNHDKIVNVADVSAYFTDLMGQSAYDINGDEQGNVADVSFIYKAILN